MSISSIGFKHNHLLLKNLANKPYKHNYKLIDPSQDNPDHIHTRYHTLEDTDFLYNLNLETSGDIKIEHTFLKNNPNGLLIDNLKLYGNIKNFNEQTEPKTISNREQLKFDGSNFFNNGRYKGFEYAFLVEVNVIFSKNLKFKNGIIDQNTIDYMNNLTGTKITPKPKPNIKTRDILPNSHDRSHKEGKYYGPIFIPDYAGQDIDIPDEKLYYENNFWRLKDEQIPSYDIDEFFKDKKIVSYNSSFEQPEISTFDAHDNLEQIETIQTWFTNVPDSEQMFYIGRPPKERIIDRSDTNNKIKDLYYTWENNNLIYYGLLTKNFILLLIKDNNIETSIFSFDYLSSLSPFHNNGEVVTSYERIKQIRIKQGFKYKDLSRWIKFRDTPRKS